MTFKTVTGKIKLSSARRTHIIQSHPIMEDYLKNLRRVLEKPDQIRYSTYNQNVLLFYCYFDKIENGKYIVVVVDKLEGLVRTAYLTHRIKTGEKYEKD
ncbi:MAG: hypothetical protein Q8Q86_03865 [Candidatus Daviesbacteria bacterium]|nr:hypothetical protein [Candidatus Daviesbacteria bacterium]